MRPEDRRLRVSLTDPLRHPVFVRYFLGQSISQVGDFAFYVALTWQVLLLTGSEAVLGLVLAVGGVAQLVFLLLGGVVVDRFSRRTIVVVLDVLLGVLTAGLAVLVALGTLEVWHLYVFGALFGTLLAIWMPAITAFLPETVPKDILQGANSLFQGARTLAMIGGPTVGALLIALSGTAAAFAFDAVTFWMSAVLLATARGQVAPSRRAPAEGGSVLRHVADGWRYVRSAPWLWITILLFTVVNAAEAGPRNVVLPAYVGVTLGGGATAIGLVLSAQSVGVLLGYVGPSFLPAIQRRGLVAYGATALVGVTVVLLAYAPNIPAILAISFARGIGFALIGLLWETSLMEFVDERFRGRVSSLDMLGSFALLPLSMAGSGVLAASIGQTTIFLLGGLVVLSCAGIGLAYRPARTFEKPKGLPSGDARPPG